jgi:hypothetical protein
MFPPTPTPMPVATAAVMIQASSYRIWGFTDDAIMLWQWAGPAKTQVLQVALIVFIVAVFAFVSMRWIQSTTDDGNL